MLSNNKKSTYVSEEPNINQNVISQTTKIVGDLNSENDFRIDGTIEGNMITTGVVVVSETGFIKGTLQGTDAHFEGKFSGKLMLSGTLTLKASAYIEGELEVGKLEVDPGATFNVTKINCNTKGVVKEINTPVKPEAKSTEKIA